MKKQHWLTIFLFVLVVHIAGIVSGNEPLQNISKPLLIPALIGFFLFGINGQQGSFKKWILLALFFSWAGDVLLMFQPKNDIFFLLGLSAFLLAHIFYIVFFNQVRFRENIKSNPWFLLLVVIYYAVLISLLSPWLGDMKIPVRIYGIVISFMFMLAMHMLFLKNKISGKWLFVGALLFVLSDSVLAINKFYQSFDAAGIIIMLTYGLAQLFIVKGAIDYINAGEKE
ncbi:MAG: lysoplasmalogenase [Chitinophagaceae bacterium]